MSSSSSEGGSGGRESAKKRPAPYELHPLTHDKGPSASSRRRVARPSPREVNPRDLEGAAMTLASISGMSSSLGIVHSATMSSPFPGRRAPRRRPATDEGRLSVMRHELEERLLFESMSIQDQHEITRLTQRIEEIYDRARASPRKRASSPPSTPSRSNHGSYAVDFSPYASPPESGAVLNSSSTISSLHLMPAPPQAPTRQQAYSRRRATNAATFVPGVGIDSPVSRRAHFLMGQLGMTQAQVAREISQHPSTISEFINGRRAESDRVQHAGRVMMKHLEALYAEYLFSLAVHRQDAHR